MYTIYVDGDLIYSPTLIDDGYYVVDPKINSELNLISTFEFGLPVGAVGYNKIQRLKSIIKVYDDDVRVFMGRCLSDELDINNQKNIYCEGELGFLQDSVVGRYAFINLVSDYFKMLINNHNSQVEASKQFHIGEITVTVPAVPGAEAFIERHSGEYLSTFDEINKQLLQTKLGGYLMPRYEIEDGVEVEYLDYLADSGGQNSQVIELGVNLIDFAQKKDGQDIFTVIVPLGAVIDEGDEYNPETRLDISSVNDGKIYLENAVGIATYGRIYKSVFWDEVNRADTLMALGLQTLAVGANIIPQIELSAIDLHTLNVDVSAIKLGEYNRVISVPHGIDTWLQCVRQSIDLENPEQSLYSFGVAPRTLTGDFN